MLDSSEPEAAYARRKHSTKMSSAAPSTRTPGSDLTRAVARIDRMTPLAGYRGQQGQTSRLAATAERDAIAHGEGRTMSIAKYATAALQRPCPVRLCTERRLPGD